MLATVGPGQRLMADAGYDSNRLRERRAASGTVAVIKPISRGVNPPTLDKNPYKRRNRTERLFSKLEH